jgi:hypothetical protein
VAAFGSVDPAGGTERLVVVAETRAAGSAELERIRGAIIEAVNAKCGLPPDHVELAPPHSVPKTSSGKIRRNETRMLYESGRLRRAARSPAGQIVRLWVGNIGPWLRLLVPNLWAAAARAARSSWLWSAAVVAGLLLRVVPSRSAMARGAAVAGSWLLGVRRDRFRVRGAGSIAREKRAVVMANRSSPADLPILAAALPVALFPSDYRAVTCLPGPLQFLFAPLRRLFPAASLLSSLTCP